MTSFFYKPNEYKMVAVSKIGPKMVDWAAATDQHTVERPLTIYVRILRSNLHNRYATLR